VRAWARHTRGEGGWHARKGGQERRGGTGVGASGVSSASSVAVVGRRGLGATGLTANTRPFEGADAPRAARPPNLGHPRPARPARPDGARPRAHRPSASVPRDAALAARATRWAVAAPPVRTPPTTADPPWAASVRLTRRGGWAHAHPRLGAALGSRDAAKGQRIGRAAACGAGAGVRRSGRRSNSERTPTRTTGFRRIRQTRS